MDFLSLLASETSAFAARCSSPFPTAIAGRGRALGPQQNISSDDAPEAACLGPLFVVSHVMNASGGRTGCFLYRGRLVVPQRPLRAATPAAGACHLAHSGSGGLEDRRVPQCQLDDSQDLDLSSYEGQELTFYMSYEESSPKIKQRAAAAAAAVAAPWRAILRDARDDLLFCVRGLPTQLQLDSERRLVTWGPSVALAFPSAEHAEAFAAGVCRVEVERCDLASSPAADLLARDAAERGTGAAAFRPATAACSAAAAPLDDASAGSPRSCPPSPAQHELQPRAGSKRKADSHPCCCPALMTPVCKPRLLSPASLLTPTTSVDLDL